jgi:hypothetical protein
VRVNATWLVLGYAVASTVVVAAVMAKHDAHCLEGAVVHAAVIAAKLFGDALVVASYLIEKTPKVGGDGRIHVSEDDCWPFGEPPF